MATFPYFDQGMALALKVPRTVLSPAKAQGPALDSPIPSTRKVSASQRNKGATVL